MITDQITAQRSQLEKWGVVNLKDVHGKLCTRADSLNEERGIVNFKNVYGTHEVKNGSKTMLLEPNAHIAPPPPRPVPNIQCMFVRSSLDESLW